MAKTNPSVLTALEAFVCEVKGERLAFSKGDPIEADHPAVKQNPHLFGPLVFRHPTRGGVEQATAAPGEKRTLSLRRKSKAAVKPTPEPEPEPEPEPVGRPMRVTDLHRSENRG
jgi:hypothetical protein